MGRDTIRLGTTRRKYTTAARCNENEKAQVNKSKLVRVCHNKQNKCNYGRQHLEEVDGSFSRVTNIERT